VLFNARRRNRRNLASAFVGEIAAAMETVESNDAIKQLQHATVYSGSDDMLLLGFIDFQLPKLAVYEANIGNLSLFDAPLPREISYFYTRLMALPGRLGAFKRADCSCSEEMKRKSGDVIEEISQIMKLGDNLLRSFRIFVSRKQPVSISRA
jgi:hypothetical protein